MAVHPSPSGVRRRVAVRRLAIAATAVLALLIGAARPSTTAAAASSSFMPTGVGTPATAVTPSGAQVVFWKGAGNHLFEAWYTGGWNGPVDVSGAYLNNATLTSSPSVAVTPSGTQIVFWQSGNDLWEAWYDTTWHGAVDWSKSAFETTTFGGGTPPPLTSAPAVAVTRDGSAQLVFWSSNGRLVEAYYTSSGWNGPFVIGLGPGKHRRHRLGTGCRHHLGWEPVRGLARLDRASDRDPLHRGRQRVVQRPSTSQRPTSAGPTCSRRHPASPAPPTTRCWSSGRVSPATWMRHGPHPGGSDRLTGQRRHSTELSR